MDDSWKQDPRLKSMSREKVELLTRFSERLKSADKNQQFGICLLVVKQRIAQSLLLDMLPLPTFGKRNRCV